MSWRICRRDDGAMRVWIQRLWLAAAAFVTLGVVGFYAGRLGMPLPIFSSDESDYLINALYPTSIVAALNPYAAPANNSVHLGMIRAIHALGGPAIIGDRLVNAAAYLGGLLALWRASAARTPWPDRIAFLLLALAFPYYRFAASNLAEGLFVGVLSLICLATGRWYRSRPIVHAVLAGALGAALVLVKPNGVASLAALGVVAILDAAAAGGWRRLLLRVALFGATFFAVGNGIQIAAHEQVLSPLSFFVSGMYNTIVHATPPPGVLGLGVLALAAMSSAAAVLAGAPIVIGLVDLFGRWRHARGRFVAEGSDLTFLMLVLALAGTIAMVTLFSMKVASIPSQTGRLWGRYFEFFVPMIWLAAAPALGKPLARRTAWICAGVMLAGLAGLLASLRAGIVLFPWDATALLAFFHPDPERAPLGVTTPYRNLAAAAVVLAAAAIALRVRPAQAGLALVLAIAVLSTHLDALWLKPMIDQRSAQERDVLAIRPSLPARGALVLLALDANDGHLGFLRLDARPKVYLGPPGQTSPALLEGVAAVVASGPETPPGGPWTRTYRGNELSLYMPAKAP
jgi:hypothetical protein